MVFTLEGAARFGPALEKLSNVDVLTYNTPTVDEMALRQAVRDNKRSVGFESIRSTFGIPGHSHPLLQDVGLHHKIQVRLLSGHPPKQHFSNSIVASLSHIFGFVRNVHSIACSL